MGMKLLWENHVVTMYKYMEIINTILFKILYILSFNCILGGQLDWDYLSIYLSIYLPTYLPIYPSIQTDVQAAHDSLKFSGRTEIGL